MTDMRTNGQAKGASDGNVFQAEIFDKEKKLIFREKLLVSSKVEGRLRSALNILIRIFGPNKKWLELVRETKEETDRARD